MATRTTSAAWRPARLESERNVTRMDYARTHGWWVRVYRGVGADKRCHSKHFSDGKHGGKRAALRAARAWRDRTLARLPASTLGNRGRAVPPGHGYVRRVLKMARVASHPVWVTWLRVEDGRCKSTSYSVELHGERAAQDMAERWLTRERKALRTRLRRAA